ncbi:MAG: DUF2127 domain-containing protein [Candidatus Saccharibacteria bacterium]|nr:DUF2127 domain-containing protein [Pseudorhodobacter sp.]
MLVSPYGRLSVWLHWLFEASLIIKGSFALGETLSGLGLLLTPNGLLLNLWAWLTHHQLTQDPNDAMAQWFHHLASTFPVHVQHFYAIYLLAHGMLKFLMVIMLARRILWAYPAAMVVLAGFVIYQSVEFFTQGSLVLLALACLDGFMIVLVYREWNVLKLSRGTGTATTKPIRLIP